MPIGIRPSRSRHAQKITFAPGSAEITADANATMDALAKILLECPAMKMEIAGHTDAQGSTGGNLSLSQARAEAVLLALQGRRVPVAGMVAKGYGEGVPIADNGTEEGREANRRIEFNLQAPADSPEVATAPDGAQTADAGATGNQPAATPTAETAAASEAAPDFSKDLSPSVAPKEAKLKPRPRPDRN